MKSTRPADPRALSSFHTSRAYEVYMAGYHAGTQAWIEREDQLKSKASIYGPLFEGQEGKES